jgi:tRNA (adenine57-N1/adenine58-N1)-methyltransferase catalytic subunit
MRLAAPGDLVLLISPDRKRFIIRLVAGGEFHTHRGVVQFDHCIGAPFGHPVTSHNGGRFTMLRPNMEEILKALPRATQIVYPKDIGYILLKLSIVPGATVIEAGSGSGVLTAALARYVTPGGHVYSYDAREDMIERARSNLDRIGLVDAVTFHQRSIEFGFAETDVDALFLDVREPWLYLLQATGALADGGFFGAIVPTINQVTELVKGLARGPFAEVEVSELLLRQYRPIPERVRPLDRLTAHTGYLLFARKTRTPALWPDAGEDAIDEGGGEPDIDQDSVGAVDPDADHDREGAFDAGYDADLSREWFDPNAVIRPD